MYSILISQIERIPEKFLKHSEGTDGLYEVCIEVGSNIYRVFCFFDEGYLVVLLQGFQKKSQKTPKNEIERAERLKQQHFDEKEL
jgi:phage-related protein